MYSTQAGPQLRNPISEVVGFRPPQLMAKVLEAFQAGQALGLGLRRQTVKPFQQCDRTIVLSVKQNLRWGQSLLLYCS